jgi:ankyrin repeat protein
VVAASFLADDPALAQARGEYEKSALHWAAEKDLADIARLLIEAGADLEQLTTWGMTPLEWAANMGNLSVARVLMERGLEPSLWCAAGLGLEEDVRRFFDSEGRLATEESHLVMTDPLKGTHVRSCSNEDRKRVVSQAFYIACRNGHTEIARFLHRQGADIDCKGFFAAPALHWAAINGHLETVELLLEKGADLGVRDEKFGGDAIGWALEGGHRDIVDLLRRHGAELSIFQAAQIGDVECVRALLDQDGELVRARNGWGSALHEAAFGGSRAVVELLLARGADPAEWTAPLEGMPPRTARQVAEARGHTDVAELLP